MTSDKRTLCPNNIMRVSSVVTDIPDHLLNQILPALTCTYMAYMYIQLACRSAILLGAAGPRLGLTFPYSEIVIQIKKAARQSKHLPPPSLVSCNPVTTPTPPLAHSTHRPQPKAPMHQCCIHGNTYTSPPTIIPPRPPLPCPGHPSPAGRPPSLADKTPTDSWFCWGKTQSACPSAACLARA